jgi:hypothetical protein
MVSVQETGPARASVEDKEVIVVHHGTGEAATAPVGGGAIQIGVEQIAIGGGRRTAQRRRDTAGGGPIGLRHHLAQFAVEVWRRRPGYVQQDEKTLALSATGGPWGRRQCHSTGHSILQARATDDVQLGDDRLNLEDRTISRVHPAPQRDPPLTPFVSTDELPPVRDSQPSRPASADG